MQCWLCLGAPPIRADAGGEQGGRHHTPVLISARAGSHLPRGTQAHLQRSMYWQPELQQRCGATLPQEPLPRGQCPTAGNEETPYSSSAPDSSAASARTPQSTPRQNHKPQSRGRRRLAQGHTAAGRARPGAFLIPRPVAALQGEVRGRDPPRRSCLKNWSSHGFERHRTTTGKGVRARV